MYSYIFSEEAENNLIDKGKEYKLNEEQGNIIEELLNRISIDPLSGNKRTDLSVIKSDFYIEEYLGDGLFISMYYDIERRYTGKYIKIERLSIYYKM